jgi:hypothetical protein
MNAGVAPISQRAAGGRSALAIRRGFAAAMAVIRASDAVDAELR